VSAGGLEQAVTGVTGTEKTASFWLSSTCGGRKVDFVDVRTWISRDIQTKTRACVAIEERRYQAAQLAFSFHHIYR